MGTMARSEDLDEIPHNATFHQVLHCMLRQNQGYFWDGPEPLYERTMSDRLE